MHAAGRPAVRLTALATALGIAWMIAGLLAATAFAGQPKPDPAPTTKPAKTAPKTPVKTTTPTTTRSHSSTSSTSHTTAVHTTPSQTTATKTTHTVPTHTSTTKTTTTKTNATTTKTHTRTPVHPPKKHQPPVATRHHVPSVAGLVTPVPATPEPTTVVTSPDSQSSSLPRMLLLTLAILFLVLSLIPWRQVFQYHLVPAQVLRLRITFVMISLSVGFGYVIAVYLNGTT